MTNSEKLLSSFSENYFYKELVYADLKFTPIGGTEIELADLIINLEDIILAIQLKERNEKDRTQDKNIEEKWLKKKCKKAKEQIKDTISYITSEKVSFINARGKKTIINPNAEVVPLVVFENDSISEYEHYKSYQFAEKMSDLLCVCQVPGEQSTDGGKIIFYKDLGIYRVLLTLTDKEAIKEYLADTVAPLYEYDEMNHSDMVRVLQCYLANDCSVKSASQELIVHRNTINYKLGKAAEILGKNLSDFDVRFQLRLGFLLYQMNEM